LRLGTFLGGLALDGARITTITGLELSRALIESILSRAGRDVASHSTSELGQIEAEGLLERSIATLHTTITNISFAASTGFYFSAAALNSATDLSQQLLVALDSILGSTDSSRAIASIVTLIRREFQNPATGQDGEKVSIADLLLGICGLALLQRWCRKVTEREIKEGKWEEVVWDVVVLDDGRRADVVGNNQIGVRDAETIRSGGVLFMKPGGNEVLDAVEREGRGGEDYSEDDLPEIDLKQRIMRSLPENAIVSISTETTTTKTITVDITGAQAPDFAPPPGVEVIEEKAHHANEVDSKSEILTDKQNLSLLDSRYRIVYRIVKNKLRSTDINARSTLEGAEEVVEAVDAEMMFHSPATSIKSPASATSSASRPSSPEVEKPPAPPPKDSSSSSILLPTPGSESGDDKLRGFSAIPIPKNNVANQKRSRKPMSSASSVSSQENLQLRKLSGTKSPASKKLKSDRPPLKSADKKFFRNSLKKGSATAISNLWSKDQVPGPTTQSKSIQQRPPLGLPTPSATMAPKSHLPVPARNSSIIPARDAPKAPQRGNPNFFSSRDLGQMHPHDMTRTPSRTSHYSIHERRRDSMVSQTDTFSIHSVETRPGSPTTFRTHLKAQGSMLRVRSEKNIASAPASPPKHHRRSQSYAPSIYTLKTNNSGVSLVLASQTRRSVFEGSETLETLMRTGHVDGLFPDHHIVRNITRFVRFASASYGASFLRIMGMSTHTSLPQTETIREIDITDHHEHHSFSRHARLPPSTILLSSFVDPQGGTDSTGHTNTGIPMVHFVSLDHDSKAVVLTCRGTLGFEDVLTDMTCDYDTMNWRGQGYSVHKGIHASARRLLSSRVLVTIRAALEECPDYGLVLCGHSLGGGVTALLAILLSEPSPTGASFVTTSSVQALPQILLTSSASEPSNAPIAQFSLPPGRPIHVYAYGPPATLSPSLRLATRGLITTVVNGQDLVPHLSLGILHDLQAVALAFKNDDSGAKGEVRNRVWSGLQNAFRDSWYQGIPPSAGLPREEDDVWAYSALKALRASMLSSKLLPPGEVFLVESMPVLRREAFVKDGEPTGQGNGLGRPATRSVLRYVRNVEKRFGEIRFGGSMLLDHSPSRYEASLEALGKGVLG
jgi:pimeloyl-ACP methyl ester carboxylesterase